MWNEIEEEKIREKSEINNKNEWISETNKDTIRIS